MPTTPTFSIVIPTRNRAATLKWSLRTCLDSDHPNFEVVISDNDSSDDTAEMVAACGDERVRYFRTPAYLSMGDNFEYALHRARGEFLIFIGDDDGIMPFSLRALDLAFRKSPKVDYINWHHNPFVWPQAREMRQPINWLSDLGRAESETPTQAWRRISRPRSADANEMNGYNLYHACIRRSVTDKTADAGVRIFASPCPDVASGIRVLPFARSKLRLPLALTSIGLSHKSNSLVARAARLIAQTDAQRSVQTEFVTMNAAAFPDAALVKYALKRLHRGVAFLSPLIDEHLARNGDLRELDTDTWRMIFIESIAGTKPNLIQGYLDDFNEIAEWMRERGASGSLGLKLSDIDAYLNGDGRMPRFFGLPFRFSDNAVERAKACEPNGPADNADGRILSVYQDDKQIWVRVRAIDDEFTIHDHIKVTTALLGMNSENLSREIFEDPAIMQAKIVLSILHRVAHQKRSQ